MLKKFVENLFFNEYKKLDLKKSKNITLRIINKLIWKFFKT